MKRAVLALDRVRIPLYYLAAVVLIGNAVLGRFMSAGGVRRCGSLLCSPLSHLPVSV